MPRIKLTFLTYCKSIADSAENSYGQSKIGRFPIIGKNGVVERSYDAFMKTIGAENKSSHPLRLLKLTVQYIIAPNALLGLTALSALNLFIPLPILLAFRISILFYNLIAWKNFAIPFMITSANRFLRKLYF